MTLVLNPVLDIVKMYVCTKNEVPTFNGSKSYSLTRYTDRHTHRLD